MSSLSAHGTLHVEPGRKPPDEDEDSGQDHPLLDSATQAGRDKQATDKGADPQSPTQPIYLPVDGGEDKAAPPEPPCEVIEKGNIDVEEEDGQDHGENEAAYPELETDQQLQPLPNFKPFFSLIEDNVTGEHHHPTVHYVFADDDPDILTSAALNILEPKTNVDDEQVERFVIVDLCADGKDILASSSLSSDWQALRAHVTQAPSWRDDGEAADRGLMLRISGQEASTGRDRRRRKGDIDGLVSAYDEQMADLGDVLSGTDIQLPREGYKTESC